MASCTSNERQGGRSKRKLMKMGLLLGIGWASLWGAGIGMAALGSNLFGDAGGFVGLLVGLVIGAGILGKTMVMVFDGE